MATGDQYRAKAQEMFDMAKREENRTMKSQLERMALAYIDLAEQADRKTAPKS